MNQVTLSLQGRPGESIRGEKNYLRYWRCLDWLRIDVGLRLTNGSFLTDRGWRINHSSWWLTNGGWQLTDGVWRLADGGWRSIDSSRWVTMDNGVWGVHEKKERKPLLKDPPEADSLQGARRELPVQMIAVVFVNLPTQREPQAPRAPHRAHRALE